MKRFFWLLLFVVTFSCSTDDSVNELEKEFTLIPDEQFEKVLIDQGFDSDQVINGQMSYADAKKITEITINLLNGYNLKGIEDFVNLKSLFIRGGGTASIGLNSNNSLTDLTLDGTHIENFLVLPLESSLKNLRIYNTSLKVLDLRESVELDTLIYSGSQLQNLNINDSEKLRFLKLNVWSDDFLELDISDNINLENVELNLNKVPSIDISRLTKLKNLDIINSPKLVCAKIFEDQIISDFKYGYHTTFTTDCENLPVKEYTIINNENLERLLIGQDIDTEDELDGKVLTKSLENATGLYVGSRQSYELESFEGLETLINLESIYFESIEFLNIDEYDFSQHPKLTYFGLDNYAGVSDKKFNIDLSQLENLETLYLWSADIGNLDFSQSPELKEITISEINPMDFDFTNNTKLESIDIEDVNSLDITQCLSLEKLAVNSSVLQSIDLSNNDNLNKLELRTPLMISLNIDNLNLETFKLSKLQLGTLEINDLIKNQSNLIQLELSEMAINNELDLKNNTLLKSLRLSNANAINNLDISANVTLKWLTLLHTNIENVNLSNNPSIERLFLSRNKLSMIDLSNLNDLLYFDGSYNELTSLDISNNLLLKHISVQNNPDLSCIKVSENQMIISADNGLDGDQSLSTNCN
jgi:hypothetical protein